MGHRKSEKIRDRLKSPTKEEDWQREGIRQMAKERLFISPAGLNKLPFCGGDVKGLYILVSQKRLKESAKDFKMPWG